MLEAEDLVNACHLKNSHTWCVRTWLLGTDPCIRALAYPLCTAVSISPTLGKEWTLLQVMSGGTVGQGLANQILKPSMMPFHTVCFN